MPDREIFVTRCAGLDRSGCLQSEEVPLSQWIVDQWRPVFEKFQRDAAAIMAELGGLEEKAGGA